MSRIALLDATSLLGQELRDRITHEDVVLLSRDPEVVGTLAEVGGSAAVVSEYSAAALEDVDLVVLCADHFRNEALVLEELPASCRAIVGSADAPPDLAPTLLAGGEGADATNQVFVSPHPGLLLLSRLLSPLASLQLRSVNTTILQSVSTYGQGALDRLFEETRSIIAFQPVVGALGGDQVSFNFAPAEIDREALTYVARDLLKQEALSIQVIQTGVFHATGASVFVEFEQEEDVEEVASLLTDRSDIDLVDEPGRPSALSSAGESALQVSLGESGRSKQISLWATMDNLRATADNISNALLELV